MKKSILHTAMHTTRNAVTTAAITSTIAATLLTSSLLYAPASLANDEDGDTGYVSYGSGDTDFYTEMFSNLVNSPDADNKNEQKDTQHSNTVATANLAEGSGNSRGNGSDDNRVISSSSENEAASRTQQNSVQVAQLGTIEPVLDDRASKHDALLDILTADLSLDVYFRSGSTAIESFYPARLVAIADLINTMDDLEIHLDGYTDRRGDKSQNIALANDRIENVRQQLIDAGVDENRIISKAFGEMKMVSAPGDLDGYTFDRKVVIRFQRMTFDSIHNMNNTLSEMDTEDAGTKSISPVVADAGNRF